MPALNGAFGPFRGNGYEVLDADLERSRQLAIVSADPMPPQLGDLFTVETRGVVHEVAVVQLACFEGGWSALCRVTDVF
ncbi:MAG: hypothetical protein JF588_24565 [Caulobacterales bacterium]|nr:hypothetical protein [Caulobacterales bacterium]